MTTEYENVREQAQQEVVFNQTELTFDLSNRSRLMPPPLTIIVYIMSSVVWICNLILSAICSPKLNIYSYLHYHTFETIRNRKYGCCWHILCKIICCGQSRCITINDKKKYGCGPYPVWIAIVLWTLLIVAIYYEINDKHDDHMHIIWVSIAIASSGLLLLFFIIYMFGQFTYNTCYSKYLCCCCEKPPTTEYFQKTNEIPKTFYATKYFESMTRYQLWKWYCCSDCCGDNSADSNAITDIEEKDMNEMAAANEVRKIHHKGCYAELILRCQDATKLLNPIKGITMSKYIDSYESKHNEINETDKSVVKTLTRDTLFCEKCYRHLDKKRIDKQLVTPWPALLDYSSVMIFLFIPI
eukprot:302311_1